LIDSAQRLERLSIRIRLYTSQTWNSFQLSILPNE